MDTWKDLAKNLNEGDKIRYCHCGTSKSSIVSNSCRGLSIYCFRCGFQDFSSHGFRRAEDLDLFKEDTKLKHSQEVKLPEGYTLDIPDKEAVWLYKAGIFPRTARFYKIGYSVLSNRVILPVFHPTISTKLMYLQMRSTDPKRIKYINPSINRQGIMFYSKGYTSTEYKHDYNKSVVVTEDILSAIRVGVLHQSISLMGTKFSTQMLNVLTKYLKVIIWLDSDEAGINASNKLSNVLSLFDITTVIIKSKKDPKMYCNSDILNKIKLGSVKC